jgi:hypothetical protein
MILTIYKFLSILSQKNTRKIIVKIYFIIKFLIIKYTINLAK